MGRIWDFEKDAKLPALITEYGQIITYKELPV